MILARLITALRRLVFSSSCLAQGTLGLLVCAFCPPAISSSNAADPKPNFVFINIDDLGYGDIVPFGATKVTTPNLDRMAKEGRKLTSHYGAPVCSPSRAALMTGCYPKRALPIAHVLFPASAVGLSPDEVTIAEVLKSAGYATACIGKWHLGDQPAFLPTRQGFDYYYGLPYSNDMGTAEDGSKSSLGKPLPKRPANRNQTAPEIKDGSGLRGQSQPPLPWLENEKVIARVTAVEQAQLTKRYTDKAIEFMQSHAEEPFFVYLPHSAVHFPHYPSAEFVGKSQGGLFGDWVQEVDREVGRILDYLRQSGLDKRTLVIFTSDNGGPTGQGANNKPLRGAKGQTYEGGIRVPTIAWWPGKVPAGTQTKAITTMMDILPTLTNLAGAALPEDRKLDGMNVWPALQGATETGPRDVFHYFRGLELEAIRQGDWKLHLAKKELYQLNDDISESKNVYDQHPAIVERLVKLAEAMDADLSRQGIGPGCRKLGRVEKPVALIP
ncbi:MAG: sulfatase [Pirellulaceae bacterium]|nr:sulfatase [Pirellulaceae bacterium]